MKIAVTSTDGKTINSHFGKAQTIYVYELDGSELKYIEKRDVEKYCSDNPMHAFRPEEFGKVYEALADCKLLYTEKIGAVPAQKCKSLGLKIKQGGGEIEAAVIK